MSGIVPRNIGTHPIAGIHETIRYSNVIILIAGITQEALTYYM